MSWNAVGLRRLCLGLASGGFVLATVAGVQAQEGFLDMLFGGARQAPVQAAPVQGASDRAYRRAERRRERAAAQRRTHLTTRYAALPQPGPAEEISGRQPVDQKAIQDDPRGVLLKDQTLRPGDIVVMPSGPKVFTGSPGKRHRMSEFEDVKHSRLVDRKTRAMLVAMMVPVGAMTPDQARKAMTVKLKLAPPDEVQAVEAGGTADPAARRVIAPWTTATP